MKDNTRKKALFIASMTNQPAIETCRWSMIYNDLRELQAKGTWRSQDILCIAQRVVYLLEMDETHFVEILETDKRISVPPQSILLQNVINRVGKLLQYLMGQHQMEGLILELSDLWLRCKEQEDAATREAEEEVDQSADLSPTTRKHCREDCQTNALMSTSQAKGFMRLLSKQGQQLSKISSLVERLADFNTSEVFSVIGMYKPQGGEYRIWVETYATFEEAQNSVWRRLYGSSIDIAQDDVEVCEPYYGKHFDSSWAMQIVSTSLTDKADKSFADFNF